MKSYLKKSVYLMLAIHLSCSKKVDCNIDLEYKDNLTYYKGKLYSGPCNSFYNNGKMMNSQNYLNGMDHGEWTFYYENGAVETIANFKENKRSGKWKYFYDNGKNIRQLSHYKKGLKDSIWTKYSLTGEVEWTQIYKNGELTDSY